jgi:hypothetical protein
MSCANLPYLDGYTRANFPPAFACMRYKSSAVRGHIRSKAALFYNSMPRLRGYCILAEPTSKDSKIFKSRARPAREREAYDREPSMGRGVSH